ncbi:hypothetical protein BDV19DRAFT_390186 [Aspergillus venezuelensis]
MTTYTPQLIREGTIRDLLYVKHSLPHAEYQVAVTNFLDQFESVDTKWGDIFDPTACQLIELCARYQKDLLASLKHKPRSLFESTMLVALALRCLTITVELGRFAIHSGDIPDGTGQFVVHQGGRVKSLPGANRQRGKGRTARTDCAVYPSIALSSTWTDFLPSPPRFPATARQKADEKDDLSTLTIYLAHILSSQLKERNSETWLSNTLALCLFAPLDPILGHVDDHPGGYLGAEMWDFIALKYKRTFQGLCELYEEGVKYTPLEKGWERGKFEALVGNAVSRRFAGELYGVWLGLFRGKNSVWFTC